MRPELSDYTHLSGGKVREIYEVDSETLLMVATDRISAFDFSLDPEIPDKGRILTATSTFYFDLLSRELGVRNHLAGGVEDERIPEEVLGRAHVVRKLDMVAFECVARGYLTGSGKKEYDANGRVCGVKLPEGLVEASRLPEPIFTPATKAEQGDHDENVTFSYVASKLGEKLASELREKTLAIYSAAAAYAESRGIILADTKLEFGLDEDGSLVLADEVLTPTPPAIGPRTPMSRAGSSRVLTSSTCVTGSRARSRAGTRPATRSRRSCRAPWSRRPATATSRRMNA